MEFTEYGPKLVSQLREEINNLMASALILTPVVRTRGDGKYEDQMAIMNQSLYRLLRIMRHLELVQVKKNGTPQPETVQERAALESQRLLDLAGLCRKIGGEVTPLAAKAGVRFTVETPDSLLIIGNEHLLVQMLLTLISNAVRAAGEGGEAGLRLSASAGRGAVSVWDNGPGVRFPGEEEELPPGEVEDALLLKERCGLGLGLPIARQVAALHGGALVLERREERGTQVVVSLDASMPEQSEKLCLHTPRMNMDPTGGFSPVLVELSDVLPFSAFSADDVE